MPVWIRSRLRRNILLLSKIKLLTERILRAAGVHDAEISLDLIGDRRMRRLNRHYRGRDATTDVLAFPMSEAEGLRSPLLGDVVISVPMAIRQAKESQQSLDQELAILLVHGVLHLLGFDHEQGKREACRMYRKERAILRSLQPIPKLVLSRGTNHGSILLAVVHLLFADGAT
jgi:probable rRNA maturation factor